MIVSSVVFIVVNLAFIATGSVFRSAKSQSAEVVEPSTPPCCKPKETVAGAHYPNERRQQVYDYVIVGAGSAGSVIANRLSEDPNVTVCLLEAGGIPEPMTDIPLKVLDIVGKPDSDWNYRTEPQKHACYGEKGQKCFWSRYKGLGGCSTHNDMYYVRGAHKDYDNWVNLGAEGWGWQDVLPYFKKFEDFRVPKYVNNGYHGVGGPQTVSPLSYKTPLHDTFLEAGRDLDYKNVDYNGDSQIGFNSIQLTQRDGRRCSTEKAYLRPAVNRTNLDILIRARALRVLFEGDTATSVVYDQGNETRSVAARREIILSAGAIGSPHLLLLSGVGPRKQLEDLGIEVVADLPVGENLHDHLRLESFTWRLNDTVSLVASRDVTNKSLAEFEENGTGPYTSPIGVENLIFINSGFHPENDNWPDFEFITMALGFPSENTDIVEDSVNISPRVLRPKSRGFLRLRSSDPYVDPILDPRYLSAEEDALHIQEGIKFTMKIMETPAFKKYNPVPAGLVRGCEEFAWGSDKYVNCTAWRTGHSAMHMVGTVKMGDPKDNSTVLDPELRVKGLKGIRVADASIMPVIVSGNTNAACIMIGEKAADIIRGN